jgi:hypothetical protein
MDPEQERYLEDPTNRINAKVDDIISLGDPDDMMIEILGTLTESQLVPDVGKYYTFVYKPKTPRIEFDEYPLIACVGLFKWGFRGVNFHWGLREGNAFRNYTWEEVIGSLHTVYPLELQDLRAIPYQNFKFSSS